MFVSCCAQLLLTVLIGARWTFVASGYFLLLLNIPKLLGTTLLNIPRLLRTSLVDSIDWCNVDICCFLLLLNVPKLLGTTLVDSIYWCNVAMLCLVHELLCVICTMEKQ